MTISNLTISEALKLGVLSMDSFVDRLNHILEGVEGWSAVDASFAAPNYGYGGKPDGIETARMYVGPEGFPQEGGYLVVQGGYERPRRRGARKRRHSKVRPQPKCHFAWFPACGGEPVYGSAAISSEIMKAIENWGSQ